MNSTFVDTDEAETWNQRNEEISDIIHPFSGSERNRLFLNETAERFVDVSGVSGVDSPADGRSFVVLDYDRDGWNDFAVINSSSPLCNLYRNRIAESGAADREHSAAGVIAIRLVGGNTTSKPSSEFSARDGYGARVKIHTDDHILLREHLCGQGLAGQNSSTMLIGIGNDAAVDVEIVWPSGRRQRVDSVVAGSLLTAWENAAESDTDNGLRIGEYRNHAADQGTDHVASAGATESVSIEVPEVAKVDGDGPRLLVFTTFASWCASCAKHQPEVHYLRDCFEQDVRFVGFPIDRSDTHEKLQSFVERNGVDYDVAFGIEDEHRDSFEAVLAESIGLDLLPSTVVTDADGRVLMTTAGLPSVSQIRRLLSAP